MSTETGERSVEQIVADLGVGNLNAAPENLDELVGKLEAMSDQQEQQSPQDDKAGEQPAKGESSSPSAGQSKTDDGPQPKAESAESQQSPPTEPVGVLLKDGKHFIPYDKHKALRNRVDTAEARVKELEAQLKGGAPATESEGKDPDRDDTAKLDDDMALIADLEQQAEAYEAEGLTALAATQRATAKSLRAMATRLQSIGGYVETARTREAETIKTREQETREAIAEAIENNPKLRYLQDTVDKDPISSEIWDEIAAEDEVLRTLPKYAKATYAERFAAAIKRVEADRGQIKLPPEYLTVADVKRDAEDKASRAGAFNPSTLSDLPGGGVPRDAGDEIQNMDPTQLARIMENASPEKMAQLLANAG